MKHLLLLTILLTGCTTLSHSPTGIKVVGKATAAQVSVIDDAYQWAVANGLKMAASSITVELRTDVVKRPGGYGFVDPMSPTGYDGEQVDLKNRWIEIASPNVIGTADVKHGFLHLILFQEGSPTGDGEHTDPRWHQLGLY